MRAYRKFAPLLAFLAPTMALGACVTFEDPYTDLINRQREDGGADAATGSGTVARFTVGSAAVPNFLDVPFPSDVYLSNGRFVALPGIERTFRFTSSILVEDLKRLNGASRIAPSLFLIDDLGTEKDLDTGDYGGGVVDRASLPADEDACVSDASSVFLVDLDATDPAAVRVPCRASTTDEHQEVTRRFYLGIGPARGIVLEEGHHYASVLTNRVKDAQGRPLLASEDFKLARSKQGPVGAVYGAAYDKVVAALSGALATDNAEIVALAPFTTQSITKDIFAMREAIEAGPAPTLLWDTASVAPMVPARFAASADGQTPAGFTATLDAWLGVATQKLPDGSDDPSEALGVRAHDKISVIGTGVFNAVNYLQQRGTYDNVDHATFLYDANGVPTPPPEAPTAKIWITFSVPKGVMPEAGFPVVIIQHGLNSSRQYMLTLANQFAAKGWMAVAIDSVTFGARSPNAQYQVDLTNDHASAADAVYKGPDGISDAINGQRSGSEPLFGNLLNFLAIRDQLRQAAIDTTQVVKLLGGNPDLTPLALDGVTPKIDATRIAYIGDSLGGIEGATAAVMEPKVKAWTFNVAGGGLFTELAAHSASVNNSLVLAGSVNFGFQVPRFTETHPITMIGQTIAEGGDPIIYARHLVSDPAPLAGAPTTARNIFQTAVVYDEVVPNEANEALARAGGWGIAAPNVGANAGVSDVKTAQPYRGGGIKIMTVDADATGIHDTPKAGVTAVLAQVSPGQHSSDLISGRCTRNYALPFHTAEGAPSFELIKDKPTFACPYRELQASMINFFADAFDGKVPVLTGLPAPTRDADGDGDPDTTDPQPAGP